MRKAICAGSSSRGYTLIEVLVVVTVLSIAGAMVIPSMANVGVLRVQTAVRTVISDIAYAQSDAMAFQEGRAVMFDEESNGYSLVEVTGPDLDPVNDVMFDPSRRDGRYAVTFNENRFAGARITSVDFGGSGKNLIFDEMGAPVSEPMGNTPSTGGLIVIHGSNQDMWISVDGFTGHIATGRGEGP